MGNYLMRSFDNIIQFNKFADLHDGQKIIFSKTDYIMQAFSDIKNLNNDVILITGNSDYCIFYKNESFLIKDLNEHVLAVFKKEKIPNNLKYWFTVNNCTNIDFIKSLPMGIENDFHCKLTGHGHGWEHAKQKKELLFKASSCKNLNSIDKQIYLNAEVKTNYQIRQPLKNFCLENNIYVEQEKLEYSSFIEKCQQFKAVLCPVGNGLDTHRFYEVLLLNRVPILLKHGNYKIYEEVYKKYPCIIIDNYIEMLQSDFIEQIDSLLKKQPNNFDFDFWNKKIVSSLS